MRSLTSFALSFIACVLLLAGCASSKEYTPPSYAFRLPDHFDTMACTALEPGQQWGDEACVARACVPPNVPVTDHQGVCCAPGQTYEKEKQRCGGEGACPEGMTAGQYGCRFADRARKLPYYEKLCNAGNLTACSATVTMLLTGSYTPFDPVAARSIAEKACEKGGLKSCSLLAFIQMKSYSAPLANHDLARELTERMCALDETSACVNLAFMQRYWDNEPDLALTTLERACVRTGYRCEALLYERARVTRTHAAYRAAYIADLDRCLDKRRADDCYRLLDTAGKQSWTTREDTYALIAPRMRADCDAHDYYKDCAFVLDHQLEFAQTINERALDKLEEDCHEDRHFEACTLIASHLLDHAPPSTEESPTQTRRREEAADRALEIACNEGRRPWTCEKLSKRALEKGAHAEALSYLDRACELYDKSACYEAGRFIFAHEDYLRQGEDRMYAEAIDRYRKGCMQDHNGACFQLGKMHYFNRVEGLSKRENYAESVALFRYYCHERSHGDSCYFLSGNYRFGKGVSKDAESYEEYVMLACQYESDRACLEMFIYVQGEPSELYDKIVASAERSLAMVRERHMDDPPEEYEEFVEDMFTDEEKFEHTMYRIAKAQKKCSEYMDEKEDCDYIGLRYRAFIKTIYKHLKKRCKGGDAHACYARGMMNFEGLEPIETSSRVFTSYFRAACELGTARACQRQAKYGFYGYYDTPVDVSQSIALAKRGCELAIKDAAQSETRWRKMECERVLRFALHAGEHEDEALALAQEDCETISPSARGYCREQIVETLMRHATSEELPESALSLLEAHCKESERGASCSMLARQLCTIDSARSRELAARQCKAPSLDVERDCSEYGRQLAADDETREEGIVLLHQSCHEERRGTACFELASRRLESPHLSHKAEAREALELGCNLDDQHACYTLGELYLGMGHVPKDGYRSKELFQKSCELGHDDACLAHATHDFN